MQIRIMFILIFLFLNESILDKDLISPSNRFFKIRTIEFLARPTAFCKVVKNKTKVNSRNCKCATNKKPFTLQHLNKVCGLRKDDKSFDSYKYTDFNKAARIVNGTRVKLGEWPWQAALIRPSNRKNIFVPYCGGALITDNVILTAAHCLPRKTTPASTIRVALGSVTRFEDQEFMKVFVAKRYRIHEKYLDAKFDYDIGLIWLKKKVKFNCYIAPVCLPFPPEPFLGDKLNEVNVWVAGYGAVIDIGRASDHMMHEELKILSNKQCVINQSFICTNAKMKGVCQGDSGGPIMIRYKGQWTTVGIVNYITKHCGKAPSVNLRVTYYESWIKQNVDIFDEDKSRTRALSKE